MRLILEVLRYVFTHDCLCYHVHWLMYLCYDDWYWNLWMSWCLHAHVSLMKYCYSSYSKRTSLTGWAFSCTIWYNTEHRVISCFVAIDSLQATNKNHTCSLVRRTTFGCPAFQRASKCGRHFRVMPQVSYKPMIIYHDQTLFRMRDQFYKCSTDLSAVSSKRLNRVYLYTLINDWCQRASLSWTYPYPEPVVFQWQSSGNPVCLELRPQCTLECHWRNASVLPVVFQWSSSGFPVVFQCVPIMQINTGSPLGHHWVLASASVVPVASQCTCGSSGLPVCSNYAN